MDTAHPKIDPYAGCFFMTSKGMAQIVSSAETEPDGFGGYLIDLEIRYVKGGNQERLANVTSATLESALNSAEHAAMEVFERDLEERYEARKRTTVKCPLCGPLTTVPGGDKHAVERTLKTHNSIHHSDH